MNATTTTDAPAAEFNVGELVDTFKVEAQEAYRQLCYDAAESKPIDAKRVREVLFAAEKTIDTFQGHIAMLRERRQAEQDLEKARELEEEWAFYQPQARALIVEQQQQADYHRAVAESYDRAALMLQQRYADRQAELIAAQCRPRNILKLRPTRSAAQRLRQISLVTIPLEQFLLTSRVKPIDKRMKLKEAVDELRADLAELKRRGTQPAELRAAEKLLTEAEKEWQEAEAMPQRIADAQEQLARLRKMQNAIMAETNSWKNLDLDVPAKKIGSPLPPVEERPTDQFVHIITTGEPDFAFSAEFNPQTGGRV